MIPYKLRLLKRYLLKHWEGEKILKDSYSSRYGKELNLANPQTFSEKLFHRMVTTHRKGNKRFTDLADKFLVREYVQKTIGETYLIHLLWQGTNPEELPFDKLPETCVAKTNHGSGANIVLKGAYDRREVVNTLKKWLGQNFYWVGREYHYYKIPRRVIVEEFIDDGHDDGPLDYRFWCFNGHPEIIQIDNHSMNINPFYDVNWQKLPISYRENFNDCDIKRPDNFDEMLSVATALSAEFDFVRVDLYNAFGRICFGELTFTPVGGNFKFTPESWDVLLGSKWNIIAQDNRQ